MKKIILCILPVLFFSARILSQHTAPSIQISDLFPLTGTWEVTNETRLSANGPWETTKANTVITRSVGGTILEENYTGTRQGKPFIAKTIFGINNQSSKFQRAFMDSEHGVIVDFEGIRSGDSLIFDKVWAYTNGSTVKLRVVYLIISPTEFSVESMRMPAGMTGWDVTGRMRYRKQKP